ncbi:MAG: hypothetical protein TREMPRED_000836 [Tremellales sp. Tagirdzhanova-0007]|nr:MAG: hypothetical protein TREMPRED_000836 [Tremellales sp. Tagirdzhanova-0007]
MLPLTTYALLTLLGARAFDYGTEPFWVVSHAPLMSTRLDPILTPGSVSSHTHQIIGTSSFSPTYTYENSVAGKCTTGNVGVDKSSYWIPQMYRKFSDGFTLIPLSYANTYYEVSIRHLSYALRLFLLSTGDEPVYEFPPGFRMLAGDATRSTFNASDPSNQAIRDGVNNWLEGSKHVTYGAGQFDQGGVCPPTHPKRIMGLFYEFIFQDDFDYVDGARVWATGDDVGYSLHGDFTNGWPVGLFQDIFDYGEICAVQDAVENCPPLAPYVTGGPYIPGNGSACNPEGVIVEEDIGYYSLLSALPGDNPLWGGSVAKELDPEFQNLENFIQAAVEVPDGWTKVVFCAMFCASKGFSIAGVEFGDECYCGNSLIGTSLANVLRTDSCGMECAGALYGRGFCGGSSNLTVYEYTGSGSPVAANETVPIIHPSGTGAPTQIIASEIREDSVSGDTGYSYMTYAVYGSPSEPAEVTLSATSTTVNLAMNRSIALASTTSTVTIATPLTVANGSFSSVSANVIDAAGIHIKAPKSARDLGKEAYGTTKRCEELQIRVFDQDDEESAFFGFNDLSGLLDALSACIAIVVLGRIKYIQVVD